MNIKMKTLSLAVLGLAGFAIAGSASAACVAGNLSAWSSTSAIGGTLTVATGGLESAPQTPSECRLDAAITASFSSGVFVRDNTPAAEARYRAQFLIDLTGTNPQTISQGMKVFGATTDTPANSLADLVRLTVIGNVGGTARSLGVFTACAGQPDSQCSGSTALAAGVNRVEIDWVKGAAGTLKVWVNSGVEASPSLTLTGDNTAWTGVDFAALGIIAPTPGFKSAHLNQAVKFDRFDSRRQTFIGTN